MRVWLRETAPVLVLDATGLCGCGLVVFGVWRVYEPAGFVVVGLMLAAAAWLLSAGRR